MQLKWVLGFAALLLCLEAGLARAGSAPAQRLPSAVLIYPLVVVEGGGQTRDTRIEIVNLTRSAKSVKCIYVSGSSCAMTNFFITLTPNQPVSWLVSQGSFGQNPGFAVPPFFGSGELKCAVLPGEASVESHNAIQGRAIVFDNAGQTIGYSAVGFRRLSSGEFTGRVDLDGSTYEQCPDELHFVFMASESGQESEAVFVPCSQDVLFQVPSTTVQVRVVNEFEQVLSASFTVQCQTQRLLRQISSVFTRDTLGTDTGHVTFRGVQSPILGLLIDRFTPGAESTSANEPFLHGGRPGTIRIP